MLLFTKYKCTWLTAVSMSLSRCITCHDVYFHQSHATKRLPPYIKWTFEDLLPCYCYAIKTNSRTTRSRLSQPTSGGKGGYMSELQAHHCMTLYLWTWLLCSVSFILAKKLPLKESNQLIGIKMSTSVFSRNNWFLILISRGKNHSQCDEFDFVL